MKLVIKILWQLLMKKKISRINESIGMINSQRNDTEK